MRILRTRSYWGVMRGTGIFLDKTMNEKLNNIFVTVEVAKLAKEKGFNEWCACLYANEIGFISHSDDCYQWATSRSEPSTVWLRIPTHFQLIEWLRVNHRTEIFTVDPIYWQVRGIDNRCYFINEKGNPLTLNEALTIALNQMP